MIPELGHFALWLVLAMSLSLMLLPTLGVIKNDQLLMAFGPRLASTQLVFTAIAFVLLIYAFINDDFSVLYVANNSNSALPTEYKISALWGAHEGSSLLWLLIICIWTQLVAIFSRSLELPTRARILAVLGVLCFGFALFLVATSNPFERILPFPPFEGADLNPQLQDIGLILHPPMLYIGYIGFAVIFAVAIAALWQGRFDPALVKWSRPWVSLPWAFLGTGIVLGSWWAYYELGWGGWWFWDAVENASFMPWLVGTALLHSLVVTEKRGLFHSWTLLLAILTFSLSMLGAFIVRSGVLTSVHAFAQDPERGLFILFFLVLICGGALLVYALRGHRITTSTGATTDAATNTSAKSPKPSLLSKETFLLVNNVLLLVVTGTVLLGTIFPLAYEVLNDGAKLSVGPPYFNTVFLPIMALLMVVIAIGPFSHWGQFDDWRSRLKPLYWAVPFSVLGGVVLSLWFAAGSWSGFSWSTLVAGSLSLWVVLTSCIHIYLSIRATAAVKALQLSAGMWLAHIGLAVTAFGVIATTSLSEETSLYLAVGQYTELGGYEFHFHGIRQLDGPNYDSVQGILEVRSTSDDEQFEMKPEKRFYRARQIVMTEAAIHPGFWRDLYIALGSEITDGSAYSMRIQYKPFVRWIWLGGLMMAFGAVLAALTRSRDKVMLRAGAGV